MPMDFPDLNSLKKAANIHGFRGINHDETESEYRVSLADHVETIDFLESQEIRAKVGWDKWSPEQNLSILKRIGLID